MSEGEEVSGEYFESRQLQKTAGALLLWGLGVGYVISGDFFGWNFGLNAGGFGGLLVATAIMATLYVTMIFSIAEMATMMPVAGGPYAFARRAMGPWGGYLTGLAVTIEYVVAPAVIATGIGEKGKEAEEAPQVVDPTYGGKVRDITPADLARNAELDQPTFIRRRQAANDAIGNDLCREYKGIVIDNDDLDVPTFLRRKAD